MKIASSDLCGIFGYSALNSCQVGVEFSLLTHEILKLDGDLCATQIVCLRGKLWITQVSDEEDYTIQTGEHFIVTKPGLVLIQSLGEAQVQLISPARLWITSFRNKHGSNGRMKSRISTRPQLKNLLRFVFVFLR